MMRSTTLFVAVIALAMTALVVMGKNITELDASCTASAKSAASTCGLSSSYIQNILDIHSAARRSINASNMQLLEWDNELADDACKVVKAGDSSAGDTKYAHLTVKTSGYMVNPISAVNNWAQEGVYYTYISSSCSSTSAPLGYCGSCSAPTNTGCNEYAQMVWGSTNKFGCARHYDTAAKKGYFSCSYSPSGLIAGKAPYISSRSFQGCSSGDDSKGYKKKDEGSSGRPWWHYLAIAGGAVLVICGGGAYFYLDGGCCEGGDSEEEEKKRAQERRRKSKGSKIGVSDDELKSNYKPMDNV